VRAVTRLYEFYPGICLTTEEKAWKNLSKSKKNLSQAKKNLSHGTVNPKMGQVLVVQFLLVSHHSAWGTEKYGSLEYYQFSSQERCNTLTFNQRHLSTASSEEQLCSECGVMLRFPEYERNFPPLQRIQNLFEAHQTSDLKSTGEFFTGGKAVGWRKWPFTAISADIKNNWS